MDETRGWYNRGYLPHYDCRYIYQFITFRLFDSVPKDVIIQWKDELSCNVSDKEQKLILEKRIHKYEDEGYGCCLLKDQRAYDIMEKTLLFYNNERYQLIEYVIMPNHVHVLIKLISDVSLGTIVHSWKSFSASEINKKMNRSGKVWMREYFDRFIRNEEHLNNVIKYIQNN